ncbi:MAG: TonB-dependent receptor, partial [Terriglobales bacterium]
DLENVQVLQGPQGTLFGRNTTGGAVLFEPAKPTNAFGGSVSVDVGSYDNQEVQGVLNVPLISDKLLLRVAVDERTREGYTTDVNTGKDYDNINYKSGRISLTYLPTANVDNTLVVYGIASDDNGTASILTNVNTTKAAFAAFPQLVTFLQNQEARGPFLTALDGPTKFQISSSAAIDTLTWQISDNFSFKNIGAFQIFKSINLYDLDGTTLPVLQSVDTGTWNNTSNPMDREVYSEEAQFSGTYLSGLLQWLAGGFFEWDTDNPNVAYATTLIGNPGNLKAYNLDPVGQDLHSRAGYTQGIVDLGKVTRALQGLHFTAGYRYTKDWKERWNGLQYPDAGACSAPLTYPNCTDRASAFFSRGTYSLALDYQLDPDVLLYVTHRTGFKSGLFNLGLAPSAAAVVPRDVKPELVADTEGGIKSQFALGTVKLRFNASVYHESYTDMQRSTFFSIPGSTLLATATSNAASATIDGADVQFAIVPTKSLEFTVNSGLMHARYDVYLSPTVGNIAGQQMPFAPNTTFSVYGTYHFPVAEARGNVSATAEFFSTAAVRQSDDRVPGNVIGAYGLLNFKLDWSHMAGSQFDGELYVNNALDRDYKVSATTYYGTANGFNSAAYGPPRMFGATLKYRF